MKPNQNEDNNSDKNQFSARRDTISSAIHTFGSKYERQSKQQQQQQQHVAGNYFAIGSANASEDKRDAKPSDPLKSSFGFANRNLSYGTHRPNGFQPNSNGQLALQFGHEDEKVSVSDIIGNFGLFQFLVLLFSGLREGCVGYDALVTSIVTQPESDFLCRNALSESQISQLVGMNSTGKLGLEVLGLGHLAGSQCKFYPTSSNSSNGWLTRTDPVDCDSWIFLSQSRASLVVDWELVCGRTWLVAFAESAYFFGMVTGNLIWGYYADKLGRRKAYLIAHLMGLTFGWAAVFAPNVGLFALCRFLAATGSIGYNVIYSIQVELIGAKHRSMSTVLNHLGWGLGVICVPFIGQLGTSARLPLALAPLVTLIMIPWAFWLPESPRWLMVNGQFQQAKRELLRAAKFNGKECDGKREQLIALLKDQVIEDKLRFDTASTDLQFHHQVQAQAGAKNPKTAAAASASPISSSSNKSNYRLLFENHLKDTLILSFASFVGHLFYYLLTINFAYTENLSTEANFLTSGLGEFLCVMIGACLLKWLSRRTIMSLCLFLMASSFAVQSLIDSDLTPALNSTILVTTNNAIGTLSALMLIFVVLIVNQEVYPTVIRQTGASIANTLGESGSTIAPWLIYLNRLIGLWRADLFCMLTCLFGIVGMQFLTKTDNIELTDL